MTQDATTDSVWLPIRMGDVEVGMCIRSSPEDYDLHITGVRKCGTYVYFSWEWGPTSGPISGGKSQASRIVYHQVQPCEALIAVIDELTV